MNCYNKNKRGLSFIEVLYSVVLMVGVMVVVSQFFSQSNQHLDRSKRYYLITQLLEQKITEIELNYEKEGLAALDEVEKEKFEDHSDYSWSLTTTEMPSIPLIQEDLEESNDITKALDNISDKISELITEVQVTVHYKKRGKEASYSLTTYFIDFKKGTSGAFLKELLPQMGGG